MKISWILNLLISQQVSLFLGFEEYTILNYLIPHYTFQAKMYGEQKQVEEILFFLSFKSTSEKKESSFYKLIKFQK